MSLFVNRVTLRLHGGAAQSRQARADSRNYLNRMLMAKRIAKAVKDYIGKEASSSNFISNLEKKIRFLEKRRAIVISQGKIYYTTNNIRLGEEGSGLIDIINTFANVIAKSSIFNEAADIAKVKTELAVKVDQLFVPSDNLDKVETHLPNRVKAFFAHPFLHARSHEMSAANILRGLNKKGASYERKRIINTYPDTKSTIENLIRKITEVRRMDMAEIVRSFDPKSMKPFNVTVFSPSGFQLMPDKKEGYPQVALVISDVHLDTKPHSRTEELLRFYYLARELQLPVVHNGDHYDLFVWRGSFLKIQEANPLIVNAANCQSKILQILGNHDLELFKRAPSEKLTHNTFLPKSGTYFDGKVYIEHGHQADRHNQPELKRGHIIVYVISYLNRFKLFRTLIPNSMRWIEVFERFWFEFKSIFTRRNEWKIYRQDAVLERIRKVFVDCSEKRKNMNLSSFSKEDPLIYIRGHDHGFGIYFTYQEIIQMVENDQVLAGRVQYANSGSWRFDNTDFFAIDYGQPGRTFVYPFVWKPTYDHFVAFKEQMKQSSQSSQTLQSSVSPAGG